jgi:hypothetical protein
MKNIVLISFSRVKRGGRAPRAMVNSLNRINKKAPAKAGAFRDRSKESDLYQ